MKIWILTSETPHHWAGGIARYVDNFARLAGAEGNEVRVISRGDKAGNRIVSRGYVLTEFVHRFEAGRKPDPGMEPDAHPGWPFNNMAYFPALSYQYAQEVERLIEEYGPPDVIECQDYAALGYFLLQRRHTDPGFLDGVPVVVHLHTPDFAVQEVNQYPRFKLPDYWTGRMERACLWLADALLSPSRFIASEIENWLEGSLPEITTIPYPWAELPDQGKIRPGGENRLLYPGRMELRKGVEPLLAACEKLWREGEDFSLDIVGGDVPTPLKGGSLEAYLKNRYAHRVGEGRLNFRGALPHEECLEYMRDATAVIIPSLWENFPNTCIEAMALGKVVIASRSGGQAEMIGENGQTGLLFDHDKPGELEERIQEALALTESRRVEIGNRALARIGSICRPETVVPARIAHFDSVICAHAPRNTFPFANQALREGPTATALPDSPLVSVVVPFFNLGEFLPECVDSLYQSRDVNLEVVIVNDGSTDEDSLKVLDRIRTGGYPGLHVLDVPNGGLARARNIGAGAAKGELVAFVDADDAVEADFFKRALHVFKRFDNVHLVYSWVRFFDGGKGIWHSWTFDLPYLLCHNQLVPIAVVRRETFLEHGRNKPHIVYGLEDYESWISLAEAGCGGVAIPEPLVRYRIRDNSMFKVIEPDKKLYLYDLISKEHPDLYRKYGLDLFNLQNANGPAYGWDQPTMFRAPQERLTNRLRASADKLRSLEERVRLLSEAEIWLQKERRRLSELAGETAVDS